MDNQLVNTQALLFLECIKIGILMGMFYDLIRISRKLIKHPDIFVQIEDFLYWIVCSLFSFSLLYMHNYANIRVFAFAGIVLGAGLYFLSFSIVFMKIATQVIQWLRKVIKYLIHIIMIPVSWIVILVGIPLKALKKLLIKYNRKSYEKMKDVRRDLQIKNADVKTEVYVRKNTFK
ncbi:MAG: hypothetical protein ATN35_07700 [Epulopiscium sp. Nele67-Bin004]|nr:MAG: hypothetical protein ATN35_07700 [Epulopiscium sp. Nele67-Bin004]